LDRFGDHHRTGEMHDRADPVLTDRPGEERLIFDVAADEDGAGGHRPVEAGGKVVDHHHRPAGVEQGKHGMAADIAGASGHQHRYAYVLRHPTSQCCPLQQKGAKSVSGAIQSDAPRRRWAMKKTARALGLVIAAAALLSGCQTTDQSLGIQEGVSVTRFHLGGPIARGEIRIEPSNPAASSSLEFRQLSGSVARELSRTGWTV